MPSSGWLPGVDVVQYQYGNSAKLTTGFLLQCGQTLKMGDFESLHGFHHRENSLEKADMEALVTGNIEITLLKGELKSSKIPGLHISKQPGCAQVHQISWLLITSTKKHDKRRNFVSQSPHR